MSRAGWTEEWLQAHQRRAVATSATAKTERRRETRRKYGNKPTVVDGEQFDSQGEAARWQQLKLLEIGDNITELRRQVRYPLTVNGVEICLYVADFVYRDAAGLHVEDFKSRATMTDVYRLKKRLMAACHGITIEEIQ
jgi:hypothetical protein